MSEENELEGSETDITTTGESEEIPAAVDAIFDKVFGDATDEEIAAEENTESQKPSESLVRERSRRLKEQDDELAEEGLVTPDKPDGEELEVPAEETATDEAEVVADGEVPAEQTPASDALDPTLRFAANQLGWTDEKINKLLKADPELAQETMTQLADTYTNLSRQYLNPQGTVVAPPSPAEAVTPAQPKGPTSELDKFYSSIEAFAESNGEDLANFAKALKSELIDPVRNILAENQVRAQELAATEARQTFGDIAGKFGKFYGSDDKSLTETERQNRATLAQVADQLRAGAKAQGRELPIKEALNRAHLIVTADYRDQVVRTQIKEQVQTRAKGITAKPTQRRDPKLVARRSDAKAIEAASRKMAELGIDEDLT